MIIFEGTLDENDFDTEIEYLNLILNKQLLLKKSILKYMDKLANSVLSSFDITNQNIAYDYLSHVRSCLEKVDLNIDYANKLLNFCSDLKNTSSDSLTIDISYYNRLFSNNTKIIFENDVYIQELILKLIDYSKFDFSSLEIQDLLDSFSHLKKDSELNNTEQSDETFTILNSSKSYSKEDFTILNSSKSYSKEDFTILNSSKSYSKEDFTNANKTEFHLEKNAISLDKSEKQSNNIETKSEKSNTLASIDIDLKENVLFISEIKQIVILPYTISKLDEILKNSSYTSYKEIIDNTYTLPISYYKYSSISRFKETYNLVKNRSNGSIKEAFDLGIELFFKYDLNPAIITACENIDELDIYLACLYDNDLNSFKCFEIVFEGLPTLTKK